MVVIGMRKSETRPEGVEPPTYRFEACHSVQLSYGRFRGQGLFRRQQQLSNRFHWKYSGIESRRHLSRPQTPRQGPSQGQVLACNAGFEKVNPLHVHRHRYDLTLLYRVPCVYPARDLRMPCCARVHIHAVA